MRSERNESIAIYDFLSPTFLSWPVSSYYAIARDMPFTTLLQSNVEDFFGRLFRLPMHWIGIGRAVDVAHKFTVLRAAIFTTSKVSALLVLSFSIVLARWDALSLVNSAQEQGVCSVASSHPASGPPRLLVRRKTSSEL